MESAAILQEMRELIERHVGDRRIEGLTVSRHESQDPDYQLTEPLLVIMAQGTKRLYLDGQTIDYGVGDLLVVTTTLPLSGHFIGATPELPALAIGVRLDPQAIAPIVARLPQLSTSKAVAGLAVSAHEAESSLLDAAVRLLRLLDNPTDADFIGPLVHQEILWLLLRSPLGPVVIEVGMGDSDLSRVSASIDLIRRRLTEPIAVDELARRAGMSLATYHRHFRRVTGSSPLQFQKTLRLQEARALLLTRATAAQVSQLVGYASPTQFSREYRRYFGESPVAHASRGR